MRVIESQIKSQTKSSMRIIPKMIFWKKTRMLRNHSFLSTVDEICKYASKLDVTKVGIIGEEGSGKTTTAKSVGHVVHKKMEQLYKIPFAVRIFYEEDLMNFQDTLASLTPANYVLIFDDVSFLEGSASKQKISNVKQAVTRIRHLEGGQDVKIILIYNYHYNLGFDKYLRQANFRYFTTVGSSEEENMEKIVKGNNMSTVRRFIKQRQKAIVSNKWLMLQNGLEFFYYKWDEPFRPVLFYNNDTLRNTVVPPREWMEEHCATCAKADNLQMSEISIVDFCNEGEKKHGERVFLSALKLVLLENGMAVHAKSTMNAKRWLGLQLGKKRITLDSLMTHYNLTITKTRLRDTMSDVINGDALKDTDDTKTTKKSQAEKLKGLLEPKKDEIFG